MSMSCMSCVYSMISLLMAKKTLFLFPTCHLHRFTATACAVHEARNHIEMAGLSHAVMVQLGHSDDAVQMVLERFGQNSVDMAPWQPWHCLLPERESLGLETFMVF